MNQLEKVYLDELADILHAENMLVKALPKMRDAADSPALSSLFETHLAETRKHVTRLETIFRSLGLPAREKKCEGMLGLLMEGQHLMQRSKPSPAPDAALGCGARKIEHFEAVSYHCLSQWARVLGDAESAALLEETLREEERMTKKLMQAGSKRLRADRLVEAA